MGIWAVRPFRVRGPFRRLRRRTWITADNGTGGWRCRGLRSSNRSRSVALAVRDADGAGSRVGSGPPANGDARARNVNDPDRTTHDSPTGPAGSRPRRARDASWPALVVFAGLVVILVALWFRARPWSDRTSTASTSLGAASSLAALTGTLALVVTIVLSARLRLVESAAGGLDRVYRFHHWLGATAFALLAFHPTLLAWRVADVSWRRAGELWYPEAGDWVLTAGQIALYAMTVAMILTVYVQLRHQALVWVQRILGIAFLPAAYHVVRTTGDVRTDDALRVYMILILAVGLFALAFHTFFGRLVTRRYHYTLESLRPLGGGVTELRLRPRGRAVPFVPGQFGFLRFRREPIGGEPHPFSFAGPPHATEARFVIKDLGDYTHHIGEVRPGAEGLIDGPYGRFSHRFVRGRRQVWIAGGIGIAPFLSMAATLPGSRYDVDLIYGFPDRQHAPFLGELNQIAAVAPTLRIHTLDESTDGLLDAARIVEMIGSLVDREYLLCGPPDMMHTLRRQLADAGVPRANVHFEDFEFA